MANCAKIMLFKWDAIKAATKEHDDLSDPLPQLLSATGSSNKFANFTPHGTIVGDLLIGNGLVEHRGNAFTPKRRHVEQNKFRRSRWRFGALPRKDKVSRRIFLCTCHLSRPSACDRKESVSNFGCGSCSLSSLRWTLVESFRSSTTGFWSSSRVWRFICKKLTIGSRKHSKRQFRFVWVKSAPLQSWSPWICVKDFCVQKVFADFILVTTNRTVVSWSNLGSSCHVQLKLDVSRFSWFHAGSWRWAPPPEMKCKTETGGHHSDAAQTKLLCMHRVDGHKQGWFYWWDQRWGSGCPRAKLLQQSLRILSMQRWPHARNVRIVLLSLVANKCQSARKREKSVLAFQNTIQYLVRQAWNVLIQLIWSTIGCSRMCMTMCRMPGPSQTRATKGHSCWDLISFGASD